MKTAFVHFIDLGTNALHTATLFYSRTFSFINCSNVQNFMLVRLNKLKKIYKSKYKMVGVLPIPIV